jgi:hypothetical protein
MIKLGQTEVTMALVYFIDRPPTEAWSTHENDSTDSGYGASASALVRTSSGNYVVYTGDYHGYMWKLEQTSCNDDSNGYIGSIRTPHLTCDSPRVDKLFHKVRLIMIPQGNYDLSVTWWVDGRVLPGGTISTVSTGAALGSFILDTDTLGGYELQDTSERLGIIGKRIQLEISNTTANEDFFISQILIDFKPLGVTDD